MQVYAFCGGKPTGDGLAAVAASGSLARYERGAGEALSRVLGERGYGKGMSRPCPAGILVRQSHGRRIRRVPSLTRAGAPNLESIP
jgi:hypothetical protein